MKYVAKESGFVNGGWTEEGEVFEFDGPRAHWMEPVEESPQKPPKGSKEAKASKEEPGVIADSKGKQAI